MRNKVIKLIYIFTVILLVILPVVIYFRYKIKKHNKAMYRKLRQNQSWWYSTKRHYLDIFKDAHNKNEIEEVIKYWDNRIKEEKDIPLYCKKLKENEYIFSLNKRSPVFIVFNENMEIIPHKCAKVLAPRIKFKIYLILIEKMPPKDLKFSEEYYLSP